MEIVEIAHKNGTRAMGILLQETPTHFKLGYKGVETIYEKKFWFRVEPKQYSKRFLTYSNSLSL